MRTNSAIAAAVLIALVGTAANAQIAQSNNPPGSTVGQAPIGHLQPRTSGFSSGTNAEEGEQRRLSTYDREQEALDRELDKRLNICRGC